ncbi:MAG: helix-turn-helix transcriptional regulator [Chitinophagaceae bacterium]|nr:helix-turn-helix transcriptional regulator [Chitinophagaceae bacterium]
MNHVTIIGDNLRELRKIHGYSQQEAADLIGVGRSCYGAYEECRAAPPIHVLISICDVYKITDLYGLVTQRLTDNIRERAETDNKSIMAIRRIKKIVENL